MATGWILLLLIIIGASQTWRKASIMMLMVTPAAMSETVTTVASVNVPYTTNAVTSISEITTSITTSAVATTLSPETRAFMQEISEILPCKNTNCSADNSKLPTFQTTHRCQCDAECHLLGECCPEAAPSRPMWRQPEALVLGVHRRYWGCADLPVISNATNKFTVSMVTSCPRGHVLERLCARNVSAALYDYKLDLPVVSGKTGAWFQNVFCAVCHGFGSTLHKQYLSFLCVGPNGAALNTSSSSEAVEAPQSTSAAKAHADSMSERDAESAFNNSVDTDGSYETENGVRKRTGTVSPTNATAHDDKSYFFVFKILQEGTYTQGELQWVSPSGVSCLLTPEPLPFDDGDGGGLGPWERPCSVHIVDRCPDDWAGDPEVAVLCSSYAYHVASLKVYKNPHCAQCNNDTRLLRCHKTFPRRRIKFRRPPSLRLIMDYEWDTAAEGCATRGGVWDALHARCQSLNEVCPARSSYKNGRCVADPVTGTGGGGGEGSGSSNSLESSREASEEGSGNSSRGSNEEGGLPNEGEGEGGEGQGELDSCLRITLEVGEFELANDSLRLTLAGSPFFGLVLPPRDYTLLDDGRALVCNDYQPVLLPTDTVQGYLTAVCLSVSAVCLALHLIIHALLPKLHNLPGKNLQALSVALLLAQLGFLLGVSPPVAVPEPLCEAIAALVHLFYLAAFCWMNVMSVDIWRTFSAAFVGRTAANPAGTHRRYAAYAWGLPAAIVACALVADHVPGISEYFRPGYAEAGICWFGSGLGLGIFLVAPVTFILMVNIALFVVTVFHLHRRQEGSRYLRKRRIDERNERSDSSTTTATTTPASPRPATIHSGPRDHVRFFLYVKLFIIMGATWLMGSLASLAQWGALWYPFVVLNGLQGAFIFVMFDLKRNVLSMLWERLLGPRPVPAVLRSPGAAHPSAPTADSSRSRTTTTTTSASGPAASVRAPAPTAAEENRHNPIKNGSVNGAVKSGMNGKDGAKSDANDSINGSPHKDTMKG